MTSIMCKGSMIKRPREELVKDLRAIETRCDTAVCFLRGLRLRMVVSTQFEWDSDYCYQWHACFQARACHQSDALALDS